VGCRAVFQNLRTIYKLKLANLTEGGVIKQLSLKGRNQKLVNLPNNLTNLRWNLCLNMNNRT
jgi:hypothetical protein